MIEKINNKPATETEKTEQEKKEKQKLNNQLDILFKDNLNNPDFKKIEDIQKKYGKDSEEVKDLFRLNDFNDFNRSMAVDLFSKDRFSKVPKEDFYSTVSRFGQLMENDIDSNIFEKGEKDPEYIRNIKIKEDAKDLYFKACQKLYPNTSLAQYDGGIYDKDFVENLDNLSNSEAIKILDQRIKRVTSYFGGKAYDNFDSKDPKLKDSYSKSNESVYKLTCLRKSFERALEKENKLKEGDKKYIVTNNTEIKNNQSFDNNENKNTQETKKEVPEFENVTEANILEYAKQGKIISFDDLIWKTELSKDNRIFVSREFTKDEIWNKIKKERDRIKNGGDKNGGHYFNDKVYGSVEKEDLLSNPSAKWVNKQDLSVFISQEYLRDIKEISDLTESGEFGNNFINHLRNINNLRITNYNSQVKK